MTVNGLAIDPARYVVNRRLDLVGLFDSLVPGDTIAVTTATRSVWTGRLSGAQSFDVSGLCLLYTSRCV